MDEQAFTVVLSLREWQVVAAGLGELPYKTMWHVLEEVQKQVAKQQEAIQLQERLKETYEKDGGPSVEPSGE